MLMTYGVEREAAGKYNRNVEMIRGWHKDKSKVPASKAARLFRIPLPVFGGLPLIREHPDWNDEEIADDPLYIDIDWTHRLISSSLSLQMRTVSGTASLVCPHFFPS